MVSFLDIRRDEIRRVRRVAFCFSVQKLLHWQTSVRRSIAALSDRAQEHCYTDRPCAGVMLDWQTVRRRITALSEREQAHFCTDRPCAGVMLDWQTVSRRIVTVQQPFLFPPSWQTFPPHLVSQTCKTSWSQDRLTIWPTGTHSWWKITSQSQQITSKLLILDLACLIFFGRAEDGLLTFKNRASYI
jgi:hypothetical protein